jgi:8-oxo-dGTP pyrophosphatase MutT (NUDIX family)
LEFKNKHNIPHKLPDGKILWESRSCAAVACSILYPFGTSPEILLVQRGPGCPDEVGKFCMPCGYIDWDESAHDAAIRETWEESGVDISSWKTNEQPWRVNHQPTAAYQNVSMYFLFQRYLSNGEAKPVPSAKNCEPGEVDSIIWTPIDDALDLDLAFTHNSVIRMLKDKLKLGSEIPL